MRNFKLVIAVLATLFNHQPALESQPLKPVKFTVVDRLTKKPLTEFSYSLSIIVPGEIDPHREAKAPGRVDVKSTNGDVRPAGAGLVQVEAGPELTGRGGRLSAQPDQVL